MRRLFEFFSEVNLDGDGSINLMEFKKHISANRPELLPMAASIFYSLDNVRGVLPAHSTAHLEQQRRGRPTKTII